MQECGFQLKMNAAKIQTKADENGIHFATYAMGDSEKGKKKIKWITIAFECLQMEA